MSEPLGYVIYEEADLKQRHRAVKAMACPQQGILVVDVTPGARKNRHWLVRDIERALGKRPVRHGKANANHRLTLLQVAGAALPIREVVVLKADHLDATAWVELFELCSLWNARVWLHVHGGGASRTQNDALTRWGLQAIDWDDFKRKTEGWSVAEVDEGEEANSASARLPVDHFTVWRAVCRRVLPADTFAGVDRALREEVALATSFLDAGVRWKALIRRFRARLKDAPDADALLIVAVAWQIACLRSGWNLQLDPGTLLLAQGATELPALDQQLARQLNFYVHPRYGAAALLWVLLREEPGVVCQLRLADVADDGSWVKRGGDRRPVPGCCRRILRNARLARQMEGAGDDEPLFCGYRQNGVIPVKGPQGQSVPVSATYFTRLLRTTQKDLGIALLTHHTYAVSGTDSTWAAAHRVRLRQIGGRPAC